MTKKTGLQQLPVNVIGGSAFGRYNKISSARTYNMYASQGGEGDSAVEWLISFPGYRSLIELLPQGEGRGVFRSVRGRFVLAVINANVYRINPNLGYILIGTLSSNTGEVFMDENLNSQICIVDGVNAYIYNHSLAPNLTVQSLSGSLVPNYVTYHNTFFLFGNGNTSSNGAAWYAYSFASNTTISQTSQLALQTKPDFAVAVKRIPGQSANVLVFGTTVCEVHQQIGGLQNYRRVNSVSIDYGCLSVSTIDAADQYIAWLGVNEFNSPVIMVFSAEGARSITTDGIAYELSRIQYPAQSTAAFIRVDGHLMYQLTFYNAVDNVTYLYDFNTGRFYNLSDQNLNYHPARQYVYFEQKNYFISLNNGKLYQISSSIPYIDENVTGETDPDKIYDMQFIRITDNYQQPDTDRFIVNRLTVPIEQGTDPNLNELSLRTPAYVTEQAYTPPGAVFVTEDGHFFFVPEGFTQALPYHPRVDLSISSDAGVTWSNTVAYPLNPLGYRKNIMNWNRLGACNTITFKFRFWARHYFVVSNGVMELK